MSVVKGILLAAVCCVVVLGASYILLQQSKGRPRGPVAAQVEFPPVGTPAALLPARVPTPAALPGNPVCNQQSVLKLVCPATVTVGGTLQVELWGKTGDCTTMMYTAAVAYDSARLQETRAQGFFRSYFPAPAVCKFRGLIPDVIPEYVVRGGPARQYHLWLAEFLPCIDQPDITLPEEKKLAAVGFTLTGSAHSGDQLSFQFYEGPDGVGVQYRDDAGQWHDNAVSDGTSYFNGQSYYPRVEGCTITVVE